MATTALKNTSVLKRRQWMREGLIDASKESYWTAFTGGSPENIIYQVKNPYAANNGHTVTFQWHAQLSKAPVEGRETAYGTGEEKKQFSSSVGVKRFRFTVDNGDKFDGADYGSLGLNEHSDSRNKLARLYQTWKDQTLFDALQSSMGKEASHVIRLDGKPYMGGTINPGNEEEAASNVLNYNQLIRLETILRTSQGFNGGGRNGRRIPLKPYKGRAMSNPCWLLVLDNWAAAKLKSDQRYQDIIINADMRGDGNKALSMVIGKIGNLMIMEAPTFFGTTPSGIITMNSTDVEIAGMRRYTKVGDKVIWEGSPTFQDESAKTNNDTFSRGLLLGAGAIQMAMGKEPDYQMQQSIDYGINSESMCEVWTQVQKTELTAELEDNKEAKIGGFDYGIIAVDIKL